MMPVWALLHLLLIGVSAAAGMREAIRLEGEHKGLDLDTLLEDAPYLTGLLAAGSVLLLAQFVHVLLRIRRPFILWVLPVPLERLLFPILGALLLCILAFCAGLTAAVAARGKNPRRLLALVVAVLLVVPVTLLQYSAGRPVASGLGAPAFSGFMVYQTSGISGAAASGATIARSLGLARTEKDMARLFGTSRMGTSSAQVVAGMARIGIKARKVVQPERDIRQVIPPAMLLMDSPYGNPESQAGAFLGFEGGRPRIWNPLDGLLEPEPEALGRIWRGRAIECELEIPNPKTKVQNPK